VFRRRRTLSEPEALATASPLEAIVMDTSARDAYARLWHDGHPVVPVARDEDRLALEQVSRLFAVPLMNIASTPVGPEQPPYDGEVVGLGDVEEEAALYAHITGRSLRMAHSVDEVFAAAAPDVIVALYASLTPALLHAAAEAEPLGGATGIVVAMTKGALCSQVVARAAAAVATGPSAVVRSDVWASVPAAVIENGEYRAVGGEADPEDL